MDTVHAIHPYVVGGVEVVGGVDRSNAYCRAGFSDDTFPATKIYYTLYSNNLFLLVSMDLSVE